MGRRVGKCPQKCKSTINVVTYVCSESDCGKVFRTNSDLNRHKRNHLMISVAGSGAEYVSTSSQPQWSNPHQEYLSDTTQDFQPGLKSNITYICVKTGCGKQFDDKQMYDEHHLIHTVGPSFIYAEPKCRKSFTNIPDLDTHGCDKLITDIQVKQELIEIEMKQDQIFMEDKCKMKSELQINTAQGGQAICIRDKTASCSDVEVAAVRVQHSAEDRMKEDVDIVDENKILTSTTLMYSSNMDIPSETSIKSAEPSCTFSEPESDHADVDDGNLDASSNFIDQMEDGLITSKDFKHNHRTETKPNKNRQYKNTYRCDDCNYFTTVKSNLVRHARIHNNKREHCIICGRKTYKLENNDPVLCAKHRNKKNRSTCASPAAETKQANITDQEMNCSNSNVEIDHQTKDNNVRTNRHSTGHTWANTIANARESTRVQCDLSQSSSDMHATLPIGYIAADSETRDKVYTCPECPNFTASSKLSLKCHDRLIHNIMRCATCDVRITSVSERKQTTCRKCLNPSTKCVKCHETLLSKSGLFLHIKCKHERDQHSKLKETNFKCPYCDRTFNAVHNRQIHVNGVHLKVRHSCTFVDCDKNYTTKAKLIAHVQRVHGASSANEELRCTKCEYFAMNKEYLANHTRLKHSDDKRVNHCPYTDQGCTMSFVDSRSLERHIEYVHVKGIEFVCGVEACKTVCRSKNTFEKHIKRHTECSSEHLCFVCGKLCISPTALNFHIKSKHNDEYMNSAKAGL